MSWSETGISRLSFFIYDEYGEEVKVKANIKYYYVPGNTDSEYEFDYSVEIVDAPEWVTEKEIREELYQWSIYDIMNPEEFNQF